MSTKRLFILAAVLIICCSGFSAQAAESKSGAQAAQAAGSNTDAQASETGAKQKRSGKTQLTVYTPQQLCCMAKYYYKKTSKDGYYPPEAYCQEEQDGTYTIDLRERVKDKNGDFHYATYAWYSLESNGKGEDTILGSSVDLTKYSKVYTPEQLCRLAQDYYYRMYDFYPPSATYTANADGTYTICLFEVVKDDGSCEHSSTCGWYTVDVCGVGQDDIMLQAVDINP